jgi:hypothetical protein
MPASTRPLRRTHRFAWRPAGRRAPAPRRNPRPNGLHDDTFLARHAGGGIANRVGRLRGNGDTLWQPPGDLACRSGEHLAQEGVVAPRGHVRCGTGAERPGPRPRPRGVGGVERNKRRKRGIMGPRSTGSRIPAHARYSTRKHTLPYRDPRPASTNPSEINLPRSDAPPRALGSTAARAIPIRRRRGLLVSGSRQRFRRCVRSE